MFDEDYRVILVTFMEIDMILIISSQQDEHALAVMQHLQQAGAAYQLLDLSSFPQHSAINIGFASAHNTFQLKTVSTEMLDFSACGAIWWRRPQAFEPHAEIIDPGYRHFVMNESYEAFTGLWHTLDAFWVNPPHSDERAQRKVYQLRQAQRLGFTIPHTLITSSRAQAEAFITQQGISNTIYKAFSATEQHWRETRQLKTEELQLLEHVKYAPVIFQEYIPATYDIRLTVIGEQLFPAAIYSQETSYKFDMRMDFERAKVAAVNLPEELCTKIRALMQALDLQYGAIDLRLTPSGDYVFLEINPAGQWLFIEAKTQQPMTAAMAELLIQNDQTRA